MNISDQKFVDQLAITLNANKVNWYVVSDIMLDLDDAGIQYDKAEFARAALALVRNDNKSDMIFMNRLVSDDTF